MDQLAFVKSCSKDQSQATQATTTALSLIALCGKHLKADDSEDWNYEMHLKTHYSVPSFNVAKSWPCRNLKPHFTGQGFHKNRFREETPDSTPTFFRWWIAKSSGSKP